MSGFIHFEYALDPSDHLVAAGIARLVQVYKTGTDIIGYFSPQGRRSEWQRGVMTCTNVQTIKILKPQDVEWRTGFN